jgi:hypothetical protein
LNEEGKYDIQTALIGWDLIKDISLNQVLAHKRW